MSATGIDTLAGEDEGEHLINDKLCPVMDVRLITQEEIEDYMEDRKRYRGYGPIGVVGFVGEVEDMAVYIPENHCIGKDFIGLVNLHALLHTIYHYFNAPDVLKNAHLFWIKYYEYIGETRTVQCGKCGTVYVHEPAVYCPECDSHYVNEVEEDPALWL